MDLPQPSLSSEAGPIASNQPEKMRSTAQPKRGAAQYDNLSFLNAFCSFHLMMLWKSDNTQKAVSIVKQSLVRWSKSEYPRELVKRELG